MTAPRGEIVELDGLRGIAILAVIFNHEWPRSGGWLSPIDFFANAGWAGVDLFFVISGFFICGIMIDTFGTPHWARNFYARRIIRIFPLYYLFLILVFTVIPLREGGPYFSTPWLRATGTPLWYFAYLTNFRQAFTGLDIPGLVRTLWSLAIEEQFYLLFPLLLIGLGVRHLPKVLTGLVIAAPAFRVAAYLISPGNSQLQYLLTPSRMDLIALGCLAAFVVRSRQWGRLAGWSTPALAAAVLLLAVTGWFTRFDPTNPLLRTAGYSAIAFAAFFIVLWCVARRSDPVSRPLRARWLTRFGVLCYGLYLCHEFVGAAVGDVFSHFDSKVHVPLLARFLFVVCAAYLTAECSWHWFEGPINRLKKRFASADYPYRSHPLAASSRSE